MAILHTVSRTVLSNIKQMSFLWSKTSFHLTPIAKSTFPMDSKALEDLLSFPSLFRLWTRLLIFFFLIHSSQCGLLAVPWTWQHASAPGTLHVPFPQPQVLPPRYLNDSLLYFRWVSAQRSLLNEAFLAALFKIAKPLPNPSYSPSLLYYFFSNFSLPSNILYIFYLFWILFFYFL